jgi:cytochrome P450
LAGEVIVPSNGSANRDPDVYERPDEFEQSRPCVRSKSFGGGIHFCVGAQLARIEMEIALGAIAPTAESGTGRP